MDVNLPLINDYIRIIQGLAQTGRNEYQVYLIRPLSSWSKILPAEELNDLLQKIELGANFLSSKEMAQLYKKAIIKSVSQNQFNLSIPGNVSIKFLKEMKNNSDVAYSDEAKQFVKILNKPFVEYSQNEYKVANNLFKNELKSADDLEVKNILNATKRSNEKLNELKKESVVFLNKIKSSINSIPAKSSRKLFIEFLLKFSLSAMPELYKNIFPLMVSMDKAHPGFKKDVLDTTAVLIYHEIIKAVRSQNINKAVHFISKYTIIFRGNPSTPNYYEVDSFEKVFFELIEKRGLWDSI